MIFTTLAADGGVAPPASVNVAPVTSTLPLTTTWSKSVPATSYGLFSSICTGPVGVKLPLIVRTPGLRPARPCRCPTRSR